MPHPFPATLVPVFLISATPVLWNLLQRLFSFFVQLFFFLALTIPQDPCLYLSCLIHLFFLCFWVSISPSGVSCPKKCPHVGLGSVSLLSASFCISALHLPSLPIYLAVSLSCHHPWVV